MTWPLALRGAGGGPAVNLPLCPGGGLHYGSRQRVRTLVTTLGMFEKLDGDREFTLTGTLEDGKSSTQERVRAIKEQCKWDLKIAPG